MKFKPATVKPRRYGAKFSSLKFKPRMKSSRRRRYKLSARCKP